MRTMPKVCANADLQVQAKFAFTCADATEAQESYELFRFMTDGRLKRVEDNQTLASDLAGFSAVSLVVPFDPALLRAELTVVAFFNHNRFMFAVRRFVAVRVTARKYQKLPLPVWPRSLNRKGDREFTHSASRLL